MKLIYHVLFFQLSFFHLSFVATMCLDTLLCLQVENYLCSTKAGLCSSSNGPGGELQTGSIMRWFDVQPVLFLILENSSPRYTLLVVRIFLVNDSGFDFSL